jgi:ribonuclease HII
MTVVYKIGIDEAGRGPLVGAVFAGAVILDPNNAIEGLADSKKLSAGRREALRVLIEKRSLAFGIASASVEEIDRMNILQATLLAMRRANQACLDMLGQKGLDSLQVSAVVDGNRDPLLGISTVCIVKGDALVPAISAASILAKTARDHSMEILHQQFPQYGFNQHKGYGTASHLAALKEFGVLLEHRRSFAPVRLWQI